MLEQSISYKHGKMNARAAYYFEDGTVNRSGMMFNDYKSGYWIENDSANHMRSEGSYMLIDRKELRQKTGVLLWVSNKCIDNPDKDLPDNITIDSVMTNRDDLKTGTWKTINTKTGKVTYEKYEFGELLKED